MKRILLILGLGFLTSYLLAHGTLKGDRAKCFQKGVLVYDGPGRVWPVSENICNVLTSTAGYHCTSCVAYFEKAKKSK